MFIYILIQQNLYILLGTCCRSTNSSHFQFLLSGISGFWVPRCAGGEESPDTVMSSSLEAGRAEDQSRQITFLLEDLTLTLHNNGLELDQLSHLPATGISPGLQPWQWDALIPVCGKSHLGHAYFGSKGSWSQDAERRIQVSRPPQECFIWGGISSALEQPKGLQDPEEEYDLGVWHSITKSKAWWVLSAAEYHGY